MMTLETYITGNSNNTATDQKLENEIAIHTCGSSAESFTETLDQLILKPAIEMISTFNNTEISNFQKIDPVDALAFSEDTMEDIVEPLRCSTEASESITGMEPSECGWVSSEYIVEALESVVEATDCIRENLRCNANVFDSNSHVSSSTFSVVPSIHMEPLGYNIEAPGNCLEAPQCKTEVLKSSLEALEVDVDALGDIVKATGSYEKVSTNSVEFSGCNEVSMENKRGQKRKRGRPKLLELSSVEIPKESPKPPRSILKSFEDHEIRRFIQSYRRFPRPFTRLEAVARDAGLQEKPQKELEELISLLYNGCHKCLKKFNKNKSFQLRSSEPTFQIGGVTVKVLEILQSEERLEPLFLSLTPDPKIRQNFRITVPCRPVYKWDVPWTLEDDSLLLQGIYEYGTGSWYPIKMDPQFNLTDKIHLDSNKKPQPEHLRKRAAYLYTVLKEQLEKKEENQLNEKKIEPKPIKKQVRKKSKEVEVKNIVIVKSKDKNSNKKPKILTKDKTRDKNSNKGPVQKRGSFPVTRSRNHTSPTNESHVTHSILSGPSIKSSTQTQNKSLVLKDSYLQKILDQQDLILNCVAEVQNYVHNYMLAKLKIMAGYKPNKVLAEFESSFLTKKK